LNLRDGDNQKIVVKVFDKSASISITIDYTFESDLDLKQPKARLSKKKKQSK